jgi:hypothetical protein
MRTLQHHAYCCPLCGSKIRKIITDDADGNVHSYVWQCRGCWREFGPEWTEVPGQPYATATILVGLEPWTAPEAEVPPTISAVAARQHNWIAALRAITALIIAAGSLMLVLSQLLEHSGSDIQTNLF